MRIIFNIDEKIKRKPSYSRVIAFKNYFDSLSSTDDNSKNRKLFVSMPPFRKFHKFIDPRVRIILDIRDGWSIAQATGYGGNVREKRIKAWITRKIERFIINRSEVTITCTPGLQRHLEKVSGRNIIMIPNGVSDSRLELISKLKNSYVKSNKNNNKIIFVCSGQFSEYGISKVKKLIKVIVERYGKNPTLIKLIGADPKKNIWLKEYYRDITSGSGEINILPRMSEEEMYGSMLDADYGITIIRDPNYDFGTKVYDYIALGIPVVNYFDQRNNFTDYFDACLDLGFLKSSMVPEIRRSVLIKTGLKDVEL